MCGTGRLSVAVWFAVMAGLWSVLRGQHTTAGERLLVCLAAPMFLFFLFFSLKTKVQLNWPAPAYFTLLILTTWFIATRLRDKQTWRPWRWWFYGTIQLGLESTDLKNTMPWVRRRLGLDRGCYLSATP